MNRQSISLVLSAIAVGLLSPIALADNTNSYFSTSTPMMAADGTVLKTVTSPAVIRRADGSTAAVINPTNAKPLVIEDRLIKEKHWFKIGIWPLFDFEIL